MSRRKAGASGRGGNCANKAAFAQARLLCPEKSRRGVRRDYVQCRNGVPSRAIRQKAENGPSPQETYGRLGAFENAIESIAGKQDEQVTIFISVHWRRSAANGFSIAPNQMGDLGFRLSVKSWNSTKRSSHRHKTREIKPLDPCQPAVPSSKE